MKYKISIILLVIFIILNLYNNKIYNKSIIHNKKLRCFSYFESDDYYKYVEKSCNKYRTLYDKENKIYKIEKNIIRLLNFTIIFIIGYSLT